MAPDPTLSSSGPPSGARSGDIALFGGVDPARPCAECDACCVTLGITDPAISKPPGVACRHLSSRGCGIYEGRPATCREFQCLWKARDLVPAELRPDRLGVMFFFETYAAPRFVTEHACFVGHSLTDERAFQTPAFQAALNGLAARHPYIPIWLSVGGAKSAAYPPSPLHEVIEGQSRDPNLLPRALMWLEGYAPLANQAAGPGSWFRDPNWRSRYAAPAPAGLPFRFGGPMTLT